MPNHSIKTIIRPCAAFLALALGIVASGSLAAQTAAIPPPTAPSPPTAANFQGSVTKGAVSPQPVDLSLDDAVQRGLQTNLGIILSGTLTAGARAERLADCNRCCPR